MTVSTFLFRNVAVHSLRPPMLWQPQQRCLSTLEAQTRSAQTERRQQRQRQRQQRPSSPRPTATANELSTTLVTFSTASLSPSPATSNTASLPTKEAQSGPLHLCDNHTEVKSKNNSSSNNKNSTNHTDYIASLVGSLTRTAIRRMKKVDIQKRLHQVDANATGLRTELVERLLDLRQGLGDTNDTSKEKQLTTEGNPNNPVPTTAAALEPVQEDDEFSFLESHETYVLQVKGLSRVNASGTGIGILLQQDRNTNKTEGREENPSNKSHVMASARKYLPGDRSHSLAEFTATVMGLQHAARLGAKRLVLETDQEVLAKQILGDYPVEKKILKPLYWRSVAVMEDLEEFSVRVVDSLPQVTELAKRAFATGKSLNMNKEVVDPLGKDFAGVGNQQSFRIASQDLELSTIDPTRTYQLYFDGGARGNPAGKSGCGMVLLDDQNVEVWCGWKYLPPMTNNMAEYHAVLLGLMCARSLGVQEVVAYGDSELVVRQLNGRYKVRDEKLRQLFEPTRQVMAAFDSVQIKHVLRTDNKRADWLANHAMDTETSHGFADVNDKEEDEEV